MKGTCNESLLEAILQTYEKTDHSYAYPFRCCHDVLGIMRVETGDVLDYDNNDGANSRNTPAGIDHYDNATVDRQVLEEGTRAADFRPKSFGAH